MILPALLLALLGACGGDRTWCDVDGLLDDEATPGATDCGTAPLDDDDAVQACLVAAFRAGGAFRGVTQQAGAGGTLVVRAWAGDDADVRVLFGVFDACGDEGCSGSVVRTRCADAAVATVGGREQLVCGEASTCDAVLCGDEAEATCP